MSYSLLGLLSYFHEVLPSLENRGGVAISSSACWDGAETRASAGFVSAVLRAVCVQCSPDSNKRNEFLTESEALVAMDKCMPRVMRDRVSSLGLSGNHNNVFFRMIRQRRPGPSEGWC